MFNHSFLALCAALVLTSGYAANAQSPAPGNVPTVAPIDREVDFRQLIERSRSKEDVNKAGHETHNGAQSGADPQGSTAERPSTPALTDSLQDVLLQKIGEDLQSLGSEIAIDELNRLARYTLEIERPDIFRTVMVSQVDQHWAELSDARTALNMIAWLPDTADNLSPRITAARLAISAGELPDLEAQRLWRDLRARVERVGDPTLLLDLAGAMILSGSSDLVTDTVNRFHPTDRKRIETFIALLETYGPRVSKDISDLIYEALIDLGGSGAGGDASVPDIARAFWAVGRTDEAFLILNLVSDPLLRLRTRFELLTIEPLQPQVAEFTQEPSDLPLPEVANKDAPQP